MHQRFRILIGANDEVYYLIDLPTYKAGWQRYNSHTDTWCRSHPAYFVAGSF